PVVVRALHPMRIPGGVQITIPEFDLCTTIVFTGDNGRDGLLVWWQDQCRQTAPTAAEWTLKLARAELEKIRPVEEQLQRVAPEMRGSNGLMKDSERGRRLHQAFFYCKDSGGAYPEAQGALRPLRHLRGLRFDQAGDRSHPPPKKPNPRTPKTTKPPLKPGALKPRPPP